MESHHTQSFDAADRLDAVITAYLKAVEIGASPDQQQWISNYPDLAAELREFFANEARVARWTAPLKAASYQTGNFSLSAPTPKLKSGAATEPLKGTFGDYELLGEIARGGMGAVYKAQQISVKRTVALKVILGGTLASPADVQRFHNEAAAAAQLEHPNIIPIYDYGTFEGQPYFTMKLVEGGSLAQHLGKAEPRTLVAILIDVCRAVHFAHQHGILHRDLKPANILICNDASKSSSKSGHGSTPQLVPMVTDFGLAKITQSGSDVTRTGAVIGTPSYMAPEQAQGEGKAVTTAADVYSLGVILYEILTGRVPFRGSSTLETLMQVLHDEPVSPRVHRRDLDSDIETICLKCLEKDPKRRYESAEALADDLSRWLAREPIRAKPVTLWANVCKWGQRNPGWAAACSVIALLSITCVVLAPISWIGWQRAIDLAQRESEARGQAQLFATEQQHARQQAELAQRAATNAQASERKARQQAEQARAQAEEAEAVARAEAYYNAIGLASNHWRAHNVIRAKDLLERVRQNPKFQELRGWEWDYLNRLCHQEKLKLQPHGGTGILWASYCGEGDKIVSIGWDQKIRIYDRQTQKTLWTSSALATWGVVGAVSSTGKIIAFTETTGKTYTVRVWDVTGNRQVVTFRDLKSPTRGLAFSPSGQRLAIVESAGCVHLANVQTGLLEHTVDKMAAWSVAFSHEGEQLAIGCSNGWVRLLDTNSAELLTQFQAHSDAVLGLAYRPQSSQLVTGSADMSARVWDSTTGKLLAHLDHNGLVFSLAFSRDGKRLATPACDMTIKVWDAETYQQVYALGGHSAPVMSVRFADHESSLISGSSDGSIRLWNAPERLECDILPIVKQSIRQISFSSDGALMLINSLKTDRMQESQLWSLPSGQVTQTFTGLIGRAAMSPNGKTLLLPLAPTADEKSVRISIRGTSDGQELGFFTVPTTGPMHLIITPDGNRAVVVYPERESAKASFTQVVQVWDIASRQLRLDWKMTVQSEVNLLTVSPCGRYAAIAITAAASAKPMPACVQMWDLTSGQLTASIPIHSNKVTSMAFSPDGRTLAIGHGMFGTPAQIELWDTADRTTRTSLKGHFAYIQGLAFSPDGRRLASASFDRTVKLWDHRRGEEVLTLHGHSKPVQAVAFSPDGQMIASGGSDGTVRLWRGAAQSHILTSKATTNEKLKLAQLTP